MNYSDNPAMVRVDFFKESGKWYATHAMEWLHYDKEFLIHDAFLSSLRKAFIYDGGNDTSMASYSGMTAVCLHPYHEYAHPLMNHQWDTKKLTGEITP